MSYPTLVRSQIDPAAISKVTRLFNGTIGDVLVELVQNARRAGATRVDLRVAEADHGAELSIVDDGCGIDDPAVVLSLGRSGWEGDVARREDPAGMGVFSLAGRDVVIRSRPRAAASGWQITMMASAWEAGTHIPVGRCDRPVGTGIIVTLEDKWRADLDLAARGAARYCPIPLFLNGAELKRQDWLEGACAVFAESGVRIGIFDDRRGNMQSHSINFHGVTVLGRFPVVTEKHASWCARVDIDDAPELQLVLPARKEMVENEAMLRLRETVRRAIYRHIAARPAHRLDFSHWLEAAALGVELPEAAPILTE